MYLTLRYPTPRQCLIWLKRRQKVLPSQIARELKVSRPFVSKAQRIAEERIGTLLKHAASVNRVKIRHLSPKYGFAVGYCSAHRMDTFILFSPKMGVQTWFDHEEDCGSCAEVIDCKRTLTQLAEEWEISLKGMETPTDMAAHMFEVIMRRLKWIE
ncbi:MAG: hypothetical protein ACFFFC_08770 [Candidatus Thorarchaeota archaeon]